MRKDFKQIGYTISLFFLGLLAWKPWIALPQEGMDGQDYELRLLFILVILIMLPHALETVDYNKAAEKTRERTKKKTRCKKSSNRRVCFIEIIPRERQEKIT